MPNNKFVVPGLRRILNLKDVEKEKGWAVSICDVEQKCTGIVEKPRFHVLFKTKQKEDYAKEEKRKNRLRNRILGILGPVYDLEFAIKFSRIAVAGEGYIYDNTVHFSSDTMQTNVTRLIVCEFLEKCQSRSLVKYIRQSLKNWDDSAAIKNHNPP